MMYTVSAVESLLQADPMYCTVPHSCQLPLLTIVITVVDCQWGVYAFNSLRQVMAFTVPDSGCVC